MEFIQTHSIIDEHDHKELIDKFGIELQDVIGEGSFGVVFKSTDLKDQQQCAVKVTQKSKEKYSQIETSILSQLDHPNIVKFKKFFEIHSNKYIVMEFVGGGTLQDLIQTRRAIKQPFTEEEISSIMVHLISAVRYIHSNNVIHRDIKPENILLERKDNFENIKVSDFGLSVQYQNGVPFSSYSQKCGTVVFMAPEILLEKQYSKPVDIWSCGIVLYMLLTLGKHPFKSRGESREEYVKRLQQIDATKPLNEQEQSVFPSDLSRDLFLRMVKKEPSNRYTASQVLKHPFITRNLNSRIPLSFQENTQLFQNERKLAQTIKAIMLVKLIQRKMATQFGENSYKMVKLTFPNDNQQLQLSENEEQTTSQGSICLQSESQSSQSGSEERITPTVVIQNQLRRLSNSSSRKQHIRPRQTTAPNVENNNEEEDSLPNNNIQRLFNETTRNSIQHNSTVNSNSKIYLKTPKDQGIPRYPRIQQSRENDGSNGKIQQINKNNITGLSKVRLSFPSESIEQFQPQVLQPIKLNGSTEEKIEQSQSQQQQSQQIFAFTDASKMNNTKAQTKNRIIGRHSKSINSISCSTSNNWNNNNNNNNNSSYFSINNTSNNSNQNGNYQNNNNNINTNPNNNLMFQSNKLNNPQQHQSENKITATLSSSQLFQSNKLKQPQQNLSIPNQSSKQLPIYSSIINKKTNTNSNITNNNSNTHLSYIPLHQAAMKLSSNNTRPKHPSHQSQLNASKAALGARRSSGSTGLTQYNQPFLSQQFKFNQTQLTGQYNSYSNISANITNDLCNISNLSPSFNSETTLIPSFFQNKTNLTSVIHSNRNEQISTAPGNTTTATTTITNDHKTLTNQVVTPGKNGNSSSKKLTFKQTNRQQNQQIKSLSHIPGMPSLTEGSKDSLDSRYSIKIITTSNNNINGYNNNKCTLSGDSSNNIPINQDNSSNNKRIIVINGTKEMLPPVSNSNTNISSNTIQQQRKKSLLMNTYGYYDDNSPSSCLHVAMSFTNKRQLVESKGGTITNHIHYNTTNDSVREAFIADLDDSNNC